MRLQEVLFAGPNVEMPIKGDPLARLQREELDEDNGSSLGSEQVVAGARRELEFMTQLNLGAAVKRSEIPEDQRLWSARWCFCQKPPRVTICLRQFRTAVRTQTFAGTPRLELVRVIISIVSHMELEMVSLIAPLRSRAPRCRTNLEHYWSRHQN